MVSIGELTKMENALRQGQNARMCNDYVAKLRVWLASGKEPPDIKRKIELLVARFGNVRFAGPTSRPH